MKEKQDNVCLTELPAFQQNTRLELQQYKGAHMCICRHEQASVSCIEHTLIWSPLYPVSGKPCYKIRICPSKLCDLGRVPP